ncbi:hypothetical protein [Paraburkholderia sp. HD33-4]|uniref:hypothetical protein n=1 Tax=Paraburkholderia sp. HD33-4 TaxID=2883242 RepID=UPI001F3E3BF0|nr:hypothetical protein [Paraburkholderia sp. HD33-4]
MFGFLIRLSIDNDWILSIYAVPTNSETGANFIDAFVGMFFGDCADLTPASAAERTSVDHILLAVEWLRSSEGRGRARLTVSCVDDQVTGHRFKCVRVYH